MTDHGWSDGLLESGFGDAPTAALMSWHARVARMIEVEAALAQALARAGLLDPTQADAVAAACDVSRLDLDALAERAAGAATPVIPLITALAEGADETAAAWLHYGATSQDIIDTATVLQLRAALKRLEEVLIAAADGCAGLADAHRDTVMAGRTLGQQAVPITFGLKAARWLAALGRRIEQLRWLQPRLLVVQLGGVAGTRAVYGDHGDQVAAALAAELDLGVPDLPWHAERDRIAELAGMLAATAATTAKIAGDLVWLASSEIGEVHETKADGPTSSAAPQKTNPVNAVAARAAGRLALAEATALLAATGEQELERAAGAWQAEGVALPSAIVRTVGAVVRLGAALANLEVDAARAAANLDANLGLATSEALATALLPALGRPRAQAVAAEVAAEAATSKQPLREVAGKHPVVREVLGEDELDQVLDPRSAVVGVATLIERALASHGRLRS